MKYLVEFKSWEDDNALNEQVSADYAYGFKASDADATGLDKFGFNGLGSFYSYLADGAIKVEGLEPTMKLTAWMETEGFKNCEKRGRDFVKGGTNGIYKISRDRSVRETSHTVNVNESTWVIECDKEMINTICGLDPNTNPEERLFFRNRVDGSTPRSLYIFH